MANGGESEEMKIHLRWQQISEFSVSGKGSQMTSMLKY